jgi:glycine/D-amino acid oxidase-like deaminating enzyme/nitrite reductase/ring-hydroxylating ferredoxin subunit
MNKSDEGKTVSYWEASENLLEAARLEHSIETEVCIIGAGISGLTTAYLLAQEGKRIVVVDDGLIGAGETCRTTAHLANAIDDRIYRLIKWHGEDHARLAVEAHSRAIDEIERIAAHEQIECDFTRLDGYLIAAEDSKDDLEKEFEAAKKFLAVEKVSQAPLPHFDTGECLRFPYQGQVHMLKYLNGMARAIQAQGGQLFSHTHVKEWEGGESPVVTTSSGHTIKAQSIVLATNYPIASKMFAKLPAYRTYVVGMRIAKDLVPPCLIWDTGDPYVYVRLQREPTYDVLIVGGEDHRTGQDDQSMDHFANLEEWTRTHFPLVEDTLYRWSGQVLETHDGLAFIGRFSSSEPNVYLITGDSGMGVTHGTIGGMLVSDLILGRDNPWEEVFKPTRMATQSLREAVPEIVESTWPYIDWIKPGDVSSVDEIKPGEGAILRNGIKKIAAYRDETGKLYQHSAVCTHLGGIVRFNPIEKTWDCPCHGSRFRVEDGLPVDTPAVAPLKENKD